MAERMEKMKGLVLKDLYYLKGFMKQYLLILGFMAVWSVMVKNSSFIVTYLLVMGNTLILSTSSMDEAVSFNRFALTMPVSRKMLVQSKYFLMLMVELAALLIGLLLGALVNMNPYPLQGTSRWVSSGNFEWTGIISLFVLFTLVGCVTMPAVFKFGVEKARHVYMISMLGLAVLVFGGFKLCQVAGISLDFLNRLEEMPSEGLLAIMLAVCVGAVAVSYRVSLKAIRNKEW